MRLGFGLGMAQRTTAAPAPTLADLYGTGLGQVPLHLAPEDAVLDGSDFVASLPNRAGNNSATASTTGITRSGNLLTTPGGPFLSLAGAVNLFGSRLFLVAALAPAAVGTGVRLAGRNASGSDRTEIHLNAPNNGIGLRRWNGTVYEAFNVPLPAATGSAMHLIEIEITGGTARAWVDGETNGSGVAVPAGWTDFLVDKVLAAQNAPAFSGQAGDICALLVDGNQAAEIATIRSAITRV